MGAQKPLTEERLKQMMEDDLRAKEAKRKYAEEHDLDPHTLKPAS